MSLDGDLFLRHCLEQGGLRFWRGTVDLVREDDVREDRTRLPLEIAALLVEYREPDHVRRQQVRGELNSLERKLECPGKGICKRRLADAGNVLDQQMAAGEQCDESEFDGLGLAFYNAFDRRLQLARLFRRVKIECDADAFAPCFAYYPISHLQDVSGHSCQFYILPD